jgi:hypothetical protein
VAQLVLVRSMRAFVLSICVVMMAGCAETRLKCYIAPRIASILASGEVPFDVYWVNDTDLAIRRTVITQYSFFCNPLPPELSRYAVHNDSHRGASDSAPLDMARPGRSFVSP